MLNACVLSCLWLTMCVSSSSTCNISLAWYENVLASSRNAFFFFTFQRGVRLESGYTHKEGEIVDRNLLHLCLLCGWRHFRLIQNRQKRRWLVKRIFLVRATDFRRHCLSQRLQYETISAIIQTSWTIVNSWRWCHDNKNTSVKKNRGDDVSNNTNNNTSTVVYRHQFGPNSVVILEECKK